jgi:hypothetical protein
MNKKINQMKKAINTFFLILTIGLMVNCSSDDNSDSDNLSTDIVGTWELISLTVNDLEFLDDTSCLDRLIFTSTTVQSLEFDDSEDGEGCVLDYTSDTGSYDISGKMLTVDIEGETITFEIVTLNDITLKLKASFTEDGETLTFFETFRRVE